MEAVNELGQRVTVKASSDTRKMICSSVDINGIGRRGGGGFYSNDPYIHSIAGVDAAF